MAISRNQLVKELEPGLNALFGLEYKQYENQSAEIYTTESSDSTGSAAADRSATGCKPAQADNPRIAMLTRTNVLFMMSGSWA